MNNSRSRFAISSLFFLHGLCFSSWGARIPAIQEFHSLSEASLGSILLAIPVGSILSMPVAASLVSRFGSKRILSIAIMLYSFALITLGLAETPLQLSAFLVCFGLCSNMVNVSLNTQAVDIEALYQKPIMASLHGLWSLAGFVGAAIGTFMISHGIVPAHHFMVISVIALLTTLFNFKYLLPSAPYKKAIDRKKFSWPDKSLLVLGIIAFCSMICEGAMFDWSGIYFKKVIGAQGGWVGAGYVAFMTTMAGTRFVADGFKARFGIQKVLTVSGLMVFAGLALSIVFPQMIFGIIGFLLVGSGVSAVVPLVFSEAGKSKTMSPSAAIAAVSTIGFLGFLIGQPLIGWIAGASNLRFSFALIALMGLMITLLAKSQKD